MSFEQSELGREIKKFTPIYFSQSLQWWKKADVLTKVQKPGHWGLVVTKNRETQMNSFADLVQKAAEELSTARDRNVDTPIFRGIGYALLALAVAVFKEKEKNS